METVESVGAWLLLLVVAVGIGFAVRGLLAALQRNFSSTTPVPALLGVAAGIGSLWLLLDGAPTTFLANLLIAATLGVVVWRLARRLLNGQAQASLGVAVLITAAVGLVWVLGVGPTKLVGFAVAIVVVLGAFAVTGTALVSEQVRRILPMVGGVAAAIGAIDYLQAFDRMPRALASDELQAVAAALWAVILAVGGSAVLFVGANRLFDRSTRNWPQFTTAVGAVLGFVVFGILDGNRLLQIAGPREPIATNLHDLVNGGPWSLLVTSMIIGGVLGAAGGSIYGAAVDDRRRAVRVGLGLGVGLGAVWGLYFAERIPVDTSIRVVWTALIGAALGGVLGYLIGRTPDDRTRLAIGAVGGLVIGLVIGGLLKNIHQPRLETVPLIVFPAVAGAVVVGIAMLRRRPWLPALATGLLIGWIPATFGMPRLGGGPEIETLLATGVAGLLGGIALGARPHPDAVGRAAIDQAGRGPVFLAPALTFITLGLVVPLLRTIYLSLFDERTENWVGLANYRTIFTDPNSFDYTNRIAVFGSQLFLIAVVVLIAALVVGVVVGARTGNTAGYGPVIARVVGAMLVLVAVLEYVLGRQTNGEQGGNWLVIVTLFLLGLLFVAVSLRRVGGRLFTGAPAVDMDGVPAYLLTFGLFMLSLALLSTLRGTLFNNLWWVVTVTFLATVLGLAVAVLADRAQYESVAKSFVFMPLAISFVGAGIIWRFMYIARDPRKEQTGVLNTIWVELGRISTSGQGRVVGIVVLVALLAVLVTVAVVTARNRSWGIVGATGALGVFVLYVLAEFTILDGIGGTGTVAENGVVQGTTILFLQDSQPFNNLWLMVVFIWIQTGFAMVIFSAAIKAVPAELIEAAKMDGATDSQVFWRVTLPSIAPTVGVVVTTLIVAVMKVFDIVKVMTNGNFDTQVVANEMWQRAFTELNFGLGSALAVVLFLAVVPVMAYNIRRMQREL